MSAQTNFKIREATLSDASTVLEIYKPFITHSDTSWEYEVPTEDEMRGRIQRTLLKFPWLICEAEDGSIAGYAYASRYHERTGWQWIVETGIYTSANFRGQGVGSLLYEKLFEILKLQGYVHVIARVAGENPGSVAFHTKLGFTFLGEWKNFGNKFGKWLNVSSFVKTINELVDNPKKPIPYSELKEEISFN